MRALTVLQPWSWAIAHAGKTIENRSRSFAYRGLLAVHAGRAWEPSGGSSPVLKAAFDPHRPAFARGRDIAPWVSPVFDAGAVVAVSSLVGVHLARGCCAPWGHTVPLRADRAGSPVYHLVLQDTRALPVPVPCRGAQGLWRLPPAVAGLVAGQLQTDAVSASSSGQSVGSPEGT